MSAMVISKHIDPEEDFLATAMNSGSTPLGYYFGYSLPSEKSIYYSSIVSLIANAVSQKLENSECIFSYLRILTISS